MQAVLECADEQMTNAKIVAVQIAGDGVFVEFADGVGGFFPGSFLQLHRESNPNQLFVSASGAELTLSDIFGLPLPSDRKPQSPPPLLM